MFGALFKPRLILLVLSVPLLLLMFPLTVFANSSSHSSFGEAAHPAVVVETSNNWSGYEDRGTSTSPVTYSDVVGSWIVPSARCSRGETSHAVFWVGLGGAAGITTLEQTGTDTACSQGKRIYYAWYEMLPAPLERLSSTTFNVQPGDSIQAEVTYVGRGIFVLTLRDSTRGWKFQVRKLGPTAPRARGTAEWIAEALTVGGSITRLTNFRRVSFYDCFANHKPISRGPTTAEVIMRTSGGLIEAEPSRLGSSGTAFSVTWDRP